MLIYGAVVGDADAKDGVIDGDAEDGVIEGVPSLYGGRVGAAVGAA